MNKKTILYILLVLCLLLVGTGAWLMYGPKNEDIPEVSPVIDIPDGDPVIYERVLYPMGGEN